MITNESINSEREKANLLCLIKLTLNTLIDQSSSPMAPAVLDDRNDDVTNFMLTLERVLNFRIRANWLSERRYFWDFVRPACIGSARQSIVERVEDVSKNRSLKDKGRTWIKFALMEKKLSELLKLVISDCNLVRKFYHDDAILTSSQAFILCDQLAGLSAIDFSFCFKQDSPVMTPLPPNGLDTDVIDLTPFLCYKSKHVRQYLRDQNGDEENQQPILATVQSGNSPEGGVVPLEKYKLEVEQRKYFEDLLRYRDRELQQLKIRYETLKTERDNEVRLMETIILELQSELRIARDETESERKKLQTSRSTTPTKGLRNFAKRMIHSPTTPTNNRHDDDETQMGPMEGTLISNQLDLPCEPSTSSRRSSHSTTTTNTEDDQYELVRQISRNTNQSSVDIKPVSSPEMLSSATSLSGPSSSSSDDDEMQEKTVTTPIVDESGRFEPIEMTAEQTNLLEEASATA